MGSIDILSDILIFLLIISYLIELFMTAIWFPMYYRKGIPIFKKEFTFSEKPYFHSNELSNNLTSEFHCTFLPSIIFLNISKNEIVFRKSWWFLRVYVPIMRGLIQIDNNKQEVTVIGYVNWYILSILCIFPLNILSDISNITHILNMIRFSVIILLIIFFILKFEFKLYNKIFKYLENKYSKNIKGENNA